MTCLCDLWNGLEVTQLLHCRDACGQPYADRTAQECYCVPSFANQVCLKFQCDRDNRASVSPAVVVLQLLLIAFSSVMTQTPPIHSDLLLAAGKSRVHFQLPSMGLIKG